MKDNHNISLIAHGRGAAGSFATFAIGSNGIKYQYELDTWMVDGVVAMAKRHPGKALNFAKAVGKCQKIVQTPKRAATYRVKATYQGFGTVGEVMRFLVDTLGMCGDNEFYYPRGTTVYLVERTI